MRSRSGPQARLGENSPGRAADLKSNFISSPLRDFEDITFLVVSYKPSGALSASVVLRGLSRLLFRQL